MRIKFSKQFKKAYQKAAKKIQQKFDQRLEIFLKNPHHPILNKHFLIGKLHNYQSINITGDWRAIFKMTEPDLVFFVTMGTHSQLYG